MPGAEKGLILQQATLSQLQEGTDTREPSLDTVATTARKKQESKF